ncbi:MAG: sugar MFS transporter, partial [Bacteroidota bacterium]
DSLVPRLQEVFEIDPGKAGLFQTAFFCAYGLVSIPAGMILARIGYKKGMILGLSIIATGCLLYYPAAGGRIFALFLLAFFVTASGMAFLQVAANPYIAVLGSEDRASSRLNLAQAFNSLGTWFAPIFGTLLILSDNIKSSDEIAELSIADKELYFSGEAAAVQTPFLYIAAALIVLALVIALFRLPKILGEEKGGTFLEALKFPQLKFGAIGIALYVAAEVAIGTFAVKYFQAMGLPEMIKESGFMSSIVGLIIEDLSAVDDKAIVGAFVTFYWGGAMIGRFIGSIVMTMIESRKVLLFNTLMVIGLLLISIFSIGFLSMWSLLLIGLFNSIMFPTIFTLAIEGLGKLKPQGSGILCSAIIGGALVPVMGAIAIMAGPADDGVSATAFGYKVGLIFPMLCYIYINFYSRRVKKYHAWKTEENLFEKRPLDWEQSQ